MKRFSLLICMMVYLSASGENIQAPALLKKEGQKPPRTFLVAIFSPDIDFIYLRGIFGTFAPPPKEVPRFGYTTGVGVARNVTDFICLETGIKYSERSWTIENTDYKGTTKGIYDFQYIVIPMKADFLIGKKRLRFITSAGLMADISLKATGTFIHTPVTGATSKITSDIPVGSTPFDIFPAISTGIDYRINGRMNLRVEPTFLYQVLGAWSDGNGIYSELLRSAGLNISFYFGL